MFSAYTIKKIMPRLLIAAVMIQLSWWVTTYAIELNNSIAQGLEGLLYAPFGGANNFVSLQSLVNSATGGHAGNIGAGFFGAAAAGTLAFFAIGSGTVLGVLALAGTAALGIVIALFTLVLRRAVLIALIVVAPIAIVAWVLPGTERVWKLWWESFSKLLLMYPLILLFIAAGRIFAYVSANSNQNGLLGFFLVVLGFFGPLFMIPATLKLAGSAFNLVSGVVNSRNKGAFDRLRNARASQGEKNREAIRSGNKFRGGNESNVRGKLNRGLMGAALIGAAGYNPMQARTRVRQAMRDHSEAQVAKYMQENADFNAFAGDDAKLHAAKFTSREQIGNALADFDKDRFGGDGNKARREEAVAQIMHAQRGVDEAVFQRSRVRAQAKTGTGYIAQHDDAKRGIKKGDFDASAMLDDINEAYGDDRNGAGRALAEMRTSLANSGQIAGLAGYGTWAGQLENVYRADKSVKGLAQRAASDAIADDTIKSVAPGQAVYGKPSSAAFLGKAHLRKMKDLAAKGDLKGLSAAMAHSAGIADAMGSASPQNADAYTNELFKQTIEIPGGVGQPPIKQTVREYIDSRMGSDPDFVMRRSTLSAQTLDDAARAQAATQIQGAIGVGTPPVGGPSGTTPPGPTTPI